MTRSRRSRRATPLVPIVASGVALAIAACQRPPPRPIAADQTSSDSALADAWIVALPDAGPPREASDAMIADCSAPPSLDASAGDGGLTVSLPFDPALTAAILAPEPWIAPPFIDGIRPKCAGIWYDEESRAGPYEARLYVGFASLLPRPIRKALLSLPGLSLVATSGRSNVLWIETVDAANINRPGADASLLFALPALAEVAGSPFSALPPATIDVTSLVAGGRCGARIQLRLRWDRSSNPAILDLWDPTGRDTGVCPASANFFTLAVTYE